MMRFSLLSLFLLAAAVPAVRGQAPIYSKDIKPFLARYCLECHSEKEPEGGLNLTSYKSMQAGGDHGPVLMAGKPDDSRMVRMVEGKTKPVMPPRKARQPSAAEVAQLRAWIAAGAKDDGAATTVFLPSIKPRLAQAPPVSSVAYRPDGKLLAAGSLGVVYLIDPDKGEIIGKLDGQTERVTAVAISKDGLFLAVASGATGSVGEVRLYRSSAGSLPGPQPTVVLKAHQDLVYDLAFRPDGKLLASCGYDRLIHLWDAATGQLVRTLRDHSDAIYAVAFSPDGKLLASGSADRAVKVWDVVTGKRLQTLSEPTDWVYTLAWHPQGRLLAAAGVDKSIRVWEVSAQGGKIVQSAFAHEMGVSRIGFSVDGKTLYSVGEDQTFKSWDAGRLVERFVYPRQSDVVMTFALRPDQKQLAIGRFDGALVLLDETTGKVQAQPLPRKTKPPTISKLMPSNGVRGRTVKLLLDGKDCEDASEAISTISGARTTVAPAGQAGSVEVQLTIPPQTPAGMYQISLKSAAGQSAPSPFTVDLFPSINEIEQRASARTAAKIKLPATVVGKIDRAGSVDWFRFEARQGEQLGVQVLTAAVGSKLEPILQLADDQGQVLTESNNGLLAYVAPRAGTYALGIRDRDYRGDAAMSYRLHIGTIPIVTGLFPLGAQRGSEVKLQLFGVNLPSDSISFKVPADAALGARLPIPVATAGEAALGNPTLVVGEFPDVVAGAKDTQLPVPGTANGRLEKAGSADLWRFAARKGQRVIVEVEARRIGSPLDSLIEILDESSRPVALATLRCVSMTYVTFRDHDSAVGGIRIESWNDLAINDYLLVGTELIRIRALPKNPDDDCQFFSASGQRIGYLGTTPTFHPQGQPMYKVALHPPGSTFPPNGLPVVTLYARNDDGGPGHGKDSRLVFDPPADGVYQVRIRDSRGQSSPLHSYRLTVRPPRPDFRVQFNPTAPTVSKGSALPINVTAERLDEFDGEIRLQLQNVPPGFRAPPTSILPSDISASLALFAEASATVPANQPPLKLVAKASIGGKEVVREVTGALPKLIEPGDIITTTEQSEVAVRPGGTVRLSVQIERRNGFKGRVPVEVRGLPHGVRVLDIGLNGILITEKESSRTFQIYAEPWVKPTDHPFVVLAKREGKNTEHAAQSVLLRVVGK